MRSFNENYDTKKVSMSASYVEHTENSDDFLVSK